MSRSFVAFLVGALVVGLVGAGYIYYQNQQTGIDIKINEGGVSIEGN